MTDLSHVYLPSTSQIEDPRERLIAKLEERRRAFRDELPGRRARIARLWADARPQAGPTELEELMHELHRLAGAGGMMGFPALGAKARLAEQAVQAYIESPPEGTWRALAQAVDDCITSPDQ